jgi:DNA-binding helix-hairpin-helix protein with protein kinase domain
MRAQPGEVFVTPARRTVQLSQKIADGGEGTVFSVSGTDQIVAKTYHNEMEPKLADKLAAMARSAAKNPSLFEFAAWPRELILDPKHGSVVGFLMPNVADHRNIHQLYGPKDRQTYFPDADWGFLIHTALNCCVAFEGIHALGHVVGDVNHSNVLVNKSAMVRLIDCDSMGIRDGASWYPCSEVGVPEFTSPELQGISLSGMERTQNHDLFGLAILIFHLLLIRHPFMGRLRNPYQRELPEVGVSIANSDFAYSRSRLTRLFPAANCPELEVLPPRIADLFEAAFEKCSSTLAGPQRPTAGTWKLALAEFEKSLKTCSKNGGHKYFARKQECTWCEIAAKSGYDYFITADTNLVSWSPQRSSIPNILREIHHQLAMNVDTNVDLHNFSPSTPTPLPFRFPDRPQPPGPCHEPKMPEEITPKSIVSMARPAPLAHIPVPQKPLRKKTAKAEMPLAPKPEVFYNHVYANVKEGFLIPALGMSLPFVFCLFAFFPGLRFFLAFTTTVAAVAMILVEYRVMCRANQERLHEWTQTCESLKQSRAAQLALEEIDFEKRKAAWQKEFLKIRKANIQIQVKYDAELVALAEEKKRRQAEADRQWEDENRLLLKKWRDEVRIAKLNWLQKTADYDRLKRNYDWKMQILSGWKERRRLAVEHLVQLTTTLDAGLQSTERARLNQIESELKDILTKISPQWEQLCSEYHHEVEAIENVSQQLEDHLRTKPIPRDLPGIGPSLYNALITAGISSAADCVLHDLLDVRGIGEKKATVLLEWAGRLRSRFVPQRSVAPSPHRKRINAKFGAAANKMEAELRKQSGSRLHSLEHQRRVVAEKRERLLKAKRQLAQARVDFGVFT